MLLPSRLLFASSARLTNTSPWLVTTSLLFGIAGRPLTLKRCKSSAILFNGKQLARQIIMNIKQEILQLREKYPHFQPSLVALLVGDHAPSKIYLERKQEAALLCGIRSQVINLPKEVSRENLVDIIKHLNEDLTVNGIIVQLPLPDKFSEFDICNTVLPIKDVDGFTKSSLGSFLQQKSSTSLLPCTALAVKHIIQSLGIATRGETCTVIGRSHNVGLPIALILGADMDKGGLDMTVTVCHRATPPSELARLCRGSALIVAAAGVPGLVTADMVRQGAVVIDVGHSRARNEVGKMVAVGDVDIGVREVASMVSPVPGGVGLCTVACLMKNTLLAAKLQYKLLEERGP